MWLARASCEENSRLCGSVLGRVVQEAQLWVRLQTWAVLFVHGFCDQVGIVSSARLCLLTCVKKLVGVY